jgi:hypothetical protein
MVKKNWLSRAPYYPLLLGIYVVLYLWQSNFSQIPAYATIQPLIAAVILSAVVYLICALIFRNVQKAAAMAALLLALVFFYGQIFNLLRDLKLFAATVDLDLWLSLLWVILFAAGVYALVRAPAHLDQFTLWLNLVFSFFMLMVVAELGYFSVTNHTANLKALGVQSAQASSSTAAAQSDSPDVYYFILDGYDRQDWLSQDIHVDNSDFITQLEGMGFVLPNCAQSNYQSTIYSMTATLNMNYIDTLGFSYSKLASMDAAGYTLALQPDLLHNQVMQQFRKMGYQIVTLKETYPFIDFANSDVVYDIEKDTNVLHNVASINFQKLFFSTTWARVLVNDIEKNPAKYSSLPTETVQYFDPEYGADNNIDDKVAQQNLYQLDKLESVATLPGKKFVYAHLMVTHVPFVFTATGEQRTDTTESKAAYGDEIQFVSTRILPIIKNILAQSKTPPIIIVQGDHGYGLNGDRREDAFKILNAYYLPNGGAQKIYDSITPVNTFRLLLDTYFGQNYPLLNDQSIWINPGFLPAGDEIVPKTCMQK